ncbi:hypothetical protein ACYULU_04140 [Breznakiellaceae bacterium SP9]
MKKKTLNLLIVSLAYVVALIAVIMISWASESFYLLDDYGEANPDAIIFIASVFFAFISSYAVYLIFTLVQWHKANTENNLAFLGLGIRVLHAVIAVVISSVLLLVCTYFWTSEYGEGISILGSELSLVVITLVLVVVLDFVAFLKFKPRP